jgi:ACT domain-containing protein
MKVTMDIELRDEPGQLILALEPVSRCQANLISVFHYHKAGNSIRGDGERVQVQLVLDAKNRKMVDQIKKELESQNIQVLRIGTEKYAETITVIMIGHVINTDIRDTINKIDNTKIAEVVDMSLSMPEINKPTSAALKINAIGRTELCKTINLLKKIAREKELLLILPIEYE